MLELEDHKTRTLKIKIASEGHDSLTDDELKYVLTHTALPYEQETIEKISLVRRHEGLVKETKLLVRCTRRLTFATWFVALATVAGALLVKKC